jgi:hypothetical protein
MIIKTYLEGKINPKEAETGWISVEDEQTKRDTVVRPCVDGFLEYTLNGENGILLAYRNNIPPCSNDLWVPGGEWKRGILNPMEALRLKMKEETNLDIANPECIGLGSVLSEKSPFDTPYFKEQRKKRKFGKGIHDFALIFFARASGNLELKSMHGPAILVNSENYDEIMTKYSVNNYIKDFTKEALRRIS